MMSECLNCGNQTRANQKTGKPVKYCNKECSNEYYKKTKRYSKRSPNWGNKTKERKARLKETRERYQWYYENKLRTYQVAEMLGISGAAAYARFKSIGLKPTVVRTGRNDVREHAFWNPEDVDKIRYKAEPIPEGYLTMEEAAAHLGYTKGTFQSKDRTNLPFIERKNAKNGIIYCYAISDLEEWNRNRLEQKAIEVEQNRLNRQILSEERMLERQAQAERERQEKEAAIQEEIDENNAKWMSQDDVCSLLGIQTIGAHLSNGRLEIKADIRGRGRWFDPTQVHELKVYLEELRSRDPHIKVYTRDDDYTSVNAYEDKLFAVKIPKLIESGRFNSKITGQLRDHFVDSIANNEKWHNNRTKLGLIKTFECRTCGKNLPYTSFLFQPTGRGRVKICKACTALIHKNTYNPELQRQKRIDNYISKFRTLIGVQIKRDLSTQAKIYREDISIPDVWHHIEENLGYNAEDLCNHLEDQFEPWMRWDNHGRGNHAQFWQIDHIIPRHTLVFQSIDDPNFAKCWALENMRPLCQHENKKRFYQAR
jgi:hypothetical protein